MSKDTLERSRRDFLIKSIAVAPVLALGGIALDARAASSSQAVAESAAAISRRSLTKRNLNSSRRLSLGLYPRTRWAPARWKPVFRNLLTARCQTPYGVGAKMYMQGPFQPDASPDLGYQLPLTPQEIYRLGIAEANNFARKRHNAPFNKVSAAQQDALLEQMESGKAEFEKLPSNVFFAALLQNTREGFFSDPVHGGNQRLTGWKLIGFPGARADFMDWVERNEKYPFPPVSISGERG